jgi:hypothetical protein
VTTGKNLWAKSLNFKEEMEIIIGIGFIGLIALFAVRKFTNTSKRKDCCR